MEKEFGYQDEFIKRRIYQLKNHEEVYKNYKNHYHNLERDVARSELDLMVLVNLILNCGGVPSPEEWDEIFLEAIDLMYGKIDTEAIKLIARCDTGKRLAAVHEE